MAKYSGLAQIKVLLCGTFLLAAAHAEEKTYPIKVPASEPPVAVAESAPAAAPAAADDNEPAPRLRENVPLHYVVKKSDTLWDIAAHFLENPWEWPEIWYGNDQIRNPHLIYPGDVLSLVMVNGRPRLVRGAGGAGGLVEERLSPRVRESDLEQPIPAIPLDAIRDFLRSPRVVTQEQLKNAPYILDFVDNHLIGGSATPVYVKNLPRGEITTYSVVRIGREYKDPDTGEVLGFEAIPVGNAEVSEPGNPGTAMLVSTTREALVGDRLIELEPENFDSSLYPRAPKREVDGRILSVFDGVSQIGQYHVVALNRGAVNGLQPGHVLTVLQSGRTATDPYSTSGSARVKLPDQVAGTVMVFKTSQRVSYALVMDSTRPMHVLDRVVKPRPTSR